MQDHQIDEHLKRRYAERLEGRKDKQHQD